MQSASASFTSVEFAFPGPVHDSSMQSKLGWAGLLLCLALYLAQTLPFLSYRWVTDESWYAATAFSLAQGHGLRNPAIGPNDIENHLDARPPGTAIVISGFFRLFGVGQITARMGSVLAGAALIIVIYWLSQNFFGRTAALVAGVLAASDNLLVLTARAARPEALTVCMVFLSLLCVAFYKRGAALIWPALSGFFLAAGTMFHVTLLGYIGSALILLVLIDKSRRMCWWRGASVSSVAFLLGLAPYIVWMLKTPLGRAGFQTEFLSRASGGSLLLRLMQEQRRYSDLVGLHMFHGHGLGSVPVRLPIPLLFLFATYVLWRYSRRWFYAELVLVAPTIVWLLYTVNKSSRYLALLTPIFCLAIGAATYAAREHRTLQRILIFCAILATVAQTCANGFLLRSSSKANYNAVTQQLEQTIPRGATAYGTITFWMALHDRAFISYERTSPQLAADQFGARYFIVGDRMMVDPENFGEKAFYTELTSEVIEIEKHADVLTQIHDTYYGDLLVYRLRQK